jgi:hypothetical protein
MGLLETALNALGDQLDDHGDDWFDKLLDQLDGLVESSSDETLKLGGQKALQILKDNPDKFINLGKKGLVVFTAHVAAGKTADARLMWLRSHASADDIIEEILRDAAGMAVDKKAQEELKKQAWEIVKLLAEGAKFLLPLLLAL